MFEVKNISKQYGSEFALRDISMEIGSGLSFITGASGSGKTTLLQIISGMESNFSGQVFFCGKELKNLSQVEKSGLYNKVFGFVWQDFNLLEERTVLENILLPRYLQEELNEKKAHSILKELKIANLANQKVAELSGGQKQRVAIARELMKDPQVIFADEPTSALDATTALEIMAILRNLAKRRAVIIVTHDTTLIKPGDTVYELDKGELLHPSDEQCKPITWPAIQQQKLTAKRAFALARTTFRRRTGRAVTSVLSLFVAAVLLLVPLSGIVTDSSQAVFDELFATYGEGLLDINIYDNFTSAAGTDGADSDEPQADVEQNIDGLFERYQNDDRVAHVLFSQPFNNIHIQIDGLDYAVESSNNMPVFNSLVTGRVPMGEKKEVAVPESFVERTGLTNEEILGKEIFFSGTIFNWENGEPLETAMSETAIVVGVVDTTMITEFEGKIYEYPLDDSFFFSPAALASMRENAGMNAQPGSFIIRCKTPEDLIAVKDELNAEGIVPLGQFELVEDMVRLNQQTTQQSGTAMWVIDALALVVVLAVAVITAGMRRREFAIEKVSGFTTAHLSGMIGAEAVLQAAAAAVLFLLTAPLLNVVTKTVWSVNILNPNILFCGVGLCVLLSGAVLSVTALVAAKTDVQSSLRMGAQ